MLIARCHLIGDEVKIKALLEQPCFWDRCFFSVECLTQNAPVFPQQIINVAHVVGTVAVLLIIKGIAAHITTKLFVNAAIDGIATFMATAFFHRFWVSGGVILQQKGNNQLMIFKVLLTRRAFCLAFKMSSSTIVACPILRKGLVLAFPYKCT